MKYPDFLQKTPWTLVAIFLLLSLGITLAGYLYYIEQKEHFKKEKGQELSAIADLKVNQIVNWRRERMGDANLVLGNSMIGSRIQQFLSRESTPAIKEEIQTWISALKHNQYDNILLLDLKGTVRFSVPKLEKEIGPYARQLALEAVKTKMAILSDLYQSKISEAVRLSLLVPILARKGSSVQTVGVLLIRIDPYRFLYPFIRSWPIASRTGESILFCRQGEEFVFLNELRHYRESALSFRLSTGDRRSSGLWSVYQGGGVVEDLDYGGKPVLLAGRSIPDSPWFLIAKEDAEEVYAPLKERAWMVALLIILMILAAGVSLGLIWRHQRSVYYRNQYQGELERQALTQHYLYLTRYANDIILLTDQGHQIIEANDRALSTYGYSMEEIMGLKPKDLRSLESQKQYEQDITHLEEQEGMIFETVHRRKDGTEFPVEISFRSMDIEGVKYHQAIIRDITNRKKAESALANEKERLAVTLRSIGDGVITTGINGNIILINRIAEELTGWFQEEAAGRPLDDCFHIINERTRERRENPVEKVINTGGIVELANGTVLISKDQRERIIADSGAPIRDQKGEILGVVLVFRDITEKIRLEEELAKAEKLESIGILAGGIAHDFNNILTAIMGNLSLAKMMLPSEDQVFERLSEAEKATLRAKDLTQQLLTFSKGGAPVKKIASIADVIKESALFGLRGSKSRCEFNLGADLWPVEIDVGQISQVIQNLVMNADQAMLNGGSIQIKAQNCTSDPKTSDLAEKFIKISICDEGKGIPSDILPKIFDPYFTTKSKGSGLGLATVYSIINRHDGNITVESKVGQGTCFNIYLPAVPGPWKKQAVLAQKTLPGSGKILVMDDDPLVNQVITDILGKLGYKVEIAYDGREALGKYKSAKNSGTPFDAVIMDLTIPGGLGGKETIEKLLKIDPRVKAIVSSGYSGDPVLSEFEKYGFKGRVTKPFSIAALSETLYQVLNPQGPGGQHEA